MTAQEELLKQTFIVYINHKRFEIEYPDPSETLISFLRRQGYTGTKLGCAEGYSHSFNLFSKFNSKGDVGLVL